MEGQYPIRAASKLSGLSIDTLRAWERRYAAVVPGRSDRGRQYSHEQIHRLILLRELVERGHQISQIAGLREVALRDLLNTQRPVLRRSEGPSGSLIDTLLDAFMNFDSWRANEELGRLAALLAPRDVVYRVVLPLMQEVGDRWHRREIGVAQEHLVSSALRNLLGSMVRLYPPQQGTPTMLIATLSGELHEFGILAAAMIASIAGLNAVLLGPNLPANELAVAAARTQAEIVLIGYSGATPAESADLTHLAAALRPGTELWVGGRGTPPAGSVTVFFSEMEAFENQCRLRAAPSVDVSRQHAG